MSIGTVLLVSPHPDDDVLGLGATEVLLREHGWSLVNLACSLGHEVDWDRRRGEVAVAAERLGFENILLDPPAAIGRTDDLDATSLELAHHVKSAAERVEADIIVGPHLREGHHGHECVARGIEGALEAIDAEGRSGPVWWQWGIWADLPRPTCYVPYDQATMAHVRYAIAAYSGENARSAYDDMYPARAVVNRTLGSERIFGFGEGVASRLPFADLITEARCRDGRWELGNPRVVDGQTMSDRVGLLAAPWSSRGAAA